jgi:large subunit ribosomal protein L23
MKQILIKPVITERAIAEARRGWYTFLVERAAHKPEIARAVGEAFGVEVTAVRTTTVPEKARRSLRSRHVRIAPRGKKAIVRLKEGQKIEIFETGAETAGSS